MRLLDALRSTAELAEDAPVEMRAAIQGGLPRREGVALPAQRVQLPAQRGGIDGRPACPLLSEVLPLGPRGLRLIPVGLPVPDMTA